MTLEELQVIITAKTDGLQKQINQVNGKLNGLGNTSNTMASKINSAFGAIKTGVAVYVIKKVTDALISCTNIAGKTETALLGLERILTAQGRSFQGANKFIQEYISDGLIPLQDAIVTYKNLAARGYDDKQIKDVMNRLKDSASFGRQSNLSLGEAVKTASEGLKNENSILVDNAGVTKNVAKMWEEYAASIGKTRDSLTMAEKRTAEYNGIMKETQFQVGDAAAYTKTYDGQVARLGATLITIKTNLGQAFMPIATVVLPLLQSLLNALATVTSYIASFMKALFGVTATNANIGKTSNNTASSINKIGDNADATGKKLKKAGQEAKHALASFDEINQLQKENSSSGISDNEDGTSTESLASGVVPLNFETNAPDINSKIQDMANNVKITLADIFKPFEESWNTYGGNITTNLSEALRNVQLLLGAIGDTLKNVWDTYGQSITDNAMKNLAGLSEILNKVSEVLLNTWTNPNVQSALMTLAGIFSDIWAIITRINDEVIKPAVLGFLDLLDPSKNPSTNSFYKELDEILKKVKDLTEYLKGDGFKYVEDFLKLFLAFKATQFVISMGLATGAVIANTTAFIENTVAMVANTAKRIGDFIASLVKSIYQLGLSAAALVTEAITLDGATIAQYALNLAMSLNPIGAVVIALTALVAGFVTAYKKCEWFRNLVNEVGSDFKKGFSDLVAWFKEKWDALWNFKIPKIKMPHFKLDGEFSLSKMTVPSVGVDWYDKGGVFTGPQVIGVGEKRPEFVGALEDLRYLIGDELDKRNFNNSESAYNSDRPIEITLQLGTTSFGKVVIDSINKLQKQAGKTLIEI